MAMNANLKVIISKLGPLSTVASAHIFVKKKKHQYTNKNQNLSQTGTNHVIMFKRTLVDTLRCLYKVI